MSVLALGAIALVGASLWISSVVEFLMFWLFSERCYRVGPLLAAMTLQVDAGQSERMDMLLATLPGYRSKRVAEGKWLLRQRLYLGTFGDVRIQVCAETHSRLPIARVEARHPVAWPALLLWLGLVPPGLFLWARLAGAPDVEPWLYWLVIVGFPVMGAGWLATSVVVCRLRARRVWEALRDAAT